MHIYLASKHDGLKDVGINKLGNDESDGDSKELSPAVNYTAD